jgi:hypothetical protein
LRNRTYSEQKSRIAIGKQLTRENLFCFTEAREKKRDDR